METLVHSSVNGPAELNLLTSWEQDPRRFRKAGVLSVIAHVAVIVGLLLVPRGALAPPARHVETHITPLIQEQEKPKLAFETPTAPAPSGGTGQIRRPDTSVAGAIRELTRGGSQGGLTVGDDTNEGAAGGIGSGINLPPSPGRAASSLE